MAKTKSHKGRKPTIRTEGLNRKQIHIDVKETHPLEDKNKNKSRMPL